MKISSLFYTIIIITLGVVAWATPPYHQQNVIKQDVVVVKEKVVEFDADTYLGLGGYYAIQNELAEKHDVNKLLEKQSEQIDALIKILAAKYGGGNVVPNTPELPPETPPQPVPNQGLNAQVFRIFKTNCVNCHGPNQADGKLKLIGQDEQGEYLADIGLRAFKVYDRTAGIKLSERGLKLMPVGGKTLSDEDVQTLWLWAMKSAEGKL